ncbi:hypothetical protein DVH05_012335 [Phytophthora capsici]|nr:hypothetical protein DVH05_012335 [Phytophthora capsici]
MPNSVEELLVQIRKIAGMRTDSAMRSSKDRDRERPSLPSEWEQCRHERWVTQDDEREDKQKVKNSVGNGTEMDDDVEMQTADHKDTLAQDDATDKAVHQVVGLASIDQRVADLKTEQNPLLHSTQGEWGGKTRSERSDNPHLMAKTPSPKRRLTDAWGLDDKWDHDSGVGAEHERYEG